MLNAMILDNSFFLSCCIHNLLAMIIFNYNICYLEYEKRQLKIILFHLRRVEINHEDYPF